MTTSGQNAIWRQTMIFKITFAFGLSCELGAFLQYRKCYRMDKDGKLQQMRAQPVNILRVY